MILGKPDIDSITEFLETERCPEYGQIPGSIDMDAPGRLVPNCGHVVEVDI